MESKKVELKIKLMNTYVNFEFIYNDFGWQVHGGHKKSLLMQGGYICNYRTNKPKLLDTFVDNQIYLFYLDLSDMCEKHILKDKELSKIIYNRIR